ncbi:hypothetical protein YH66_05360 [[Brevibacterium] flavum]|uniref:Uncharacterized protein n=1 Tax=[Brevibacterium] flavum TaxID=92706 RepID=A0A0F6Z4Q3_9CORY|nr:MULTISPECIES: hypothetical protein [Corynebacterium]AKF27022.1 hypothetical protein YH66_05360 [[Brevibacterium] flavum]ANE07845.1 hypothetical protein A3654_05345 [Corynebacterium glutamicum]AST20262.1 hypothetical protein CEY17_05415 [Corynebacterium glutamicum ATCC 14067]KEI22738.1 hypothetical protein KIQ_009200 [Corynebacterium glutamicum ATCC 14067]KIH74275.1 hypothetical protein SD36_05380 [Corynebacterium glutamicum]
MSSNSDFSKASDALIAAVESARESYDRANDARSKAVEVLFDCYETSVLTAEALHRSPEAASRQRALAKSNLVAMEAQCLLLAQELDSPSHEYVHRLREITSHRKNALGY